MAGARPDTWMPLYIGDYLADTMRLTNTQHGIYLLLIMAYWRDGGPLTDDDSELSSIAKCSPQEWRKQRPVISRFFHIEDGRWVHKRIDAELGDATTKTQERSKSGSEGARKRWQRDGKPVAEPLANGIAEPLANAWQNDAPSPSPSPSPSKQASKHLDPEGLPREWAEAASSERSAAGLPPVDLTSQWAKFIRKINDEPTIERWVGWALKARQQPPGSGSTDPGGLPEAPWQQRCRAWAKGHRWNPNDGPAPDEPGCWAPADLVAEAMRQRGGKA